MRTQKIEQTSLTFDDVQILDGYSKLDSRSKVDISVDGLGMPVFNAAMDTVISVDMAHFLLSFGCGVIHHRADYVEERVEKLKECYKFKYQNDITDTLLGAAVGLDERMEDVERMIEAGAELIAVKVAAAQNEHVLGQVRMIREMIDENYPEVELMVGNVSSAEALHLYKGLVDWICVSQGGGSVCSTRKKTGVGKPAFQAVMDMHNARAENWSNGIDNLHDTKIVADGGIRKGGDIVKALGAGAHAVMLGSMLAGHPSCPTPDKYRGMASKNAKQDRGEEGDYVEGVEKEVAQRKGNVGETLIDIQDAIRSGVGTAGYEDVESFIGNARFERVTVNGVREAEEHFNG